MAKKTVVCQTCRKAFEADEGLAKAFCLYCGAENRLMADGSVVRDVDLSDLPTDPIERRTFLERLVASGGPEAAQAHDRLLFWPARFEAVDRRATRFGDKFVELLTIMSYFSANYPSRGAMKRAVKERDKILARPALKKAMSEAAHPRKTLQEEFFDAACVYLLACRDDKHYGAKLFDLVRMKEEDIARKASHDVAINMMGYFCQIGLVPETETAIRALHQAWPAVFSHYPDFVDDDLATLPDPIRTAIYRILSTNPDLQEVPS